MIDASTHRPMYFFVFYGSLVLHILCVNTLFLFTTGNGCNRSYSDEEPKYRTVINIIVANTYSKMLLTLYFKYSDLALCLGEKD